MNAITAAQRFTPVYTPPVRALAPISTSSQGSTAAATPSTSVSLGQSQTTPVQTYSPNGLASTGQVRYIWEKDSGNKLGTAMTIAVQASSNGGRFAGIGAALLDQLAANGGRNISQSVLTFSGTEQPDATGLRLQQDSLRENATNTVTFNLTTASGATVTLSLASGEQGLAVSAEVQGGQLSADELKGLAGLADGFQSALNGLTQVPPRVQIGDLVKVDPALFTSLQLNASLDVAGETQTFDLRLDEQSRSLALQGPSGRVQLDLDASSTRLGSAAQRQAAIDNYLSQFDAAQKRGKGDENLMRQFKDAFTQLNAADNGKKAVNDRISLIDTGSRALLSGLADFSASISQTPGQSNPLHPEESDRFSYRASQSTSLKGSGLNRSVQQDQQAELKAAYHKGLNPLVDMQLGMDRESQNYSYHEINDQSSSSTRLAYDKGRLVEASATQQASQSERVRTYVKGELTEDVTTPASARQSRNLLGVLDDVMRRERNAREQTGASILDDALQSLRSRWQLQSTPSAIAA